MKTLWKSIKCRVWMIVSLVLVVLFTVVTILTTTMFSSVISTVLGGRRAVYADGIDPIYTSDYNTKEATLDAANELNATICEEGFVLLKNEDNALPIATRESGGSTTPRISVFGKNSVNLAYGGTGSGGAMDSQLGDRIDLYAALEEAGYELNPTLKAFYEDTSASGPVRTTSTDMDSGDTVVYSTAETPQTSYTQAIKDSYSEYSDAAIVVFTRQGGEGADFPRLMKGATGARNEDDHFLQLDQNETDLLAAVCAEFDKVVVVINSGTPMELAFLEDPDYYAYQSNIDAAIWIGYPGNTGTLALGRILNGSVNPSGKLPDTYAADFKADPTWFNFGDNRITGNMNASTPIPGGDQYILNGTPQLYYFVDYEEGVYVGYRYYETRGETDGEQWYDDAVVYPFGYGLSYTSFSWTVSDDSSIKGVALNQASADADAAYTITVDVTNTGSVAGKDVVQLYGHAPYTEGGIEKPEVVLLDYTKTELIQPGETKSVTLTFDPYYLASYDYSDANGNGFKGYELEAGDYMLYVSTDAHDRSNSIAFDVAAEGIHYATDPVTDNPVVNRYTDQENDYFNSDTQLSTILSRSDWEGTIPDSPTDEEYNVTQEFIDALKDTSTNNPTYFSTMEMPWFDEDVTVTFRDMVTNEDGVYAFGDDTSAMWEPFVDYYDDRWEALLDACSAADLIAMYDNGNFKSEAIENIGKPLTNDTDGPAGFVNFMEQDLPENMKTYWGTCYYCCESVLAATWNKDMAFAYGEMIGDEGVWGADGRGNGMPYSGWYAPGANIHRSPFGGRNPEYYSEDPLLSGKMGANVVMGAQSKGVYCFVKHFAVNEQETHRSIGGLVTWVNEQSMREIYLRSFEIIVKEGGTRAMMSSFNRIGTRWTGGDYRLLTEILRNEWGFKGMVICDFNTIPQYMNSRQMAYAGGDLNLATLPETWADESDTGDMIVLRQNAKNVFYTVMNSNAMNGEIVGYNMPIWQIILIVVDCVVVAGIAVWGFFVIRSAIKKSRQSDGQNQ